MVFDEHFHAFTKLTKSDACPDTCECKELIDIPTVWVPPPQKHPFAGIIISRDPTTAFIPYYTEAQSKDLSLWREHLFATNAIPQWTFQRISEFNRKYMDGALSEGELETFRKTLCHSVYWTHLHKCCTDKRGEDSLKFKWKNAFCCADRWLKSEIELAGREDVRFIIALGKDVKRWFEKKGDDLPVGQGIRVYHLPHPSRANMGSWNPKDVEVQLALGERIKELVLRCQDIFE
ncbi:uracil-DNA glycosylase family protein [Methanogenium organophilum]|uniref:Uracil-DNA glycosylase-like domain-containing protein n=1 Tax=Methanogenium organophilum TaxID=2199 RepID=A0A9X9T952_METOG|nr:uracil-DNA glycosylase family protein [Methanogenium organophilum]WAI01797.1 hypothetical protein OU421_02675 [Methanogenium organophilum]